MNHLIHLAEVPSKTAGEEDMDSRNREDWRTVLPRRNRNKNRKGQMIIGDNKDSESVEAVPKFVDLYVTRMKTDTTKTSLSNLLKETFLEVIREQIKSIHPPIYSSFKVRILATKFKKAMEPKIWPHGSYFCDTSRLNIFVRVAHVHLWKLYRLTSLGTAEHVQKSRQDFFHDERIFGSFFFNKRPPISFQHLGGHGFVNQISPQRPVSAPQGIIEPGCGKAPDHCPNTKYRSYDGSCNNLRNPVWGTPNTQYNRLLPPNYADKISNPPLAKSGNNLPLARSLSLVLYPDVPIEDPIFTLLTMQFAQIVTHDTSMTAGNPQIQHYKTRCCSDDGQLLELANVPEHCFPIVLPDDDPRPRCVGGSAPAEQLTSVNHFLDLSIVYGREEEENHQLRHFDGGRLRAEKRDGFQWPPRAMNATGACRLKKPKDACYIAGDTRVNQNPQLTLLHVVLLREHNRIANELSKLNPHWEDETLFQEARKINIAQYQHITYYEMLPYFIGWDNALKNKVVWDTQGPVDDYDEHVNPSVLTEHSTGAFRQFHSLIVGHLHLVHEKRASHGHIRLSDWLVSPEILEKKFDDLARGLTTQQQSASDQFHDSEVTQYLFREANDEFGIDLKAFDIQRSRDHGLPSYNDYREFWNLGRAHRFEDFQDVISKENVEKLASLYETPDDVDFIVGGTLEKNVVGALVGPTFLRVLTEQFFRTRVGDRFWFEHHDEFTLKQLQEIRKASISKLLCDNSHHIRFMQPRGFEAISENNPLTPCESLPSIDLSAWRNEYPSQPIENIPYYQQGNFVH
ncbi:hypothetical protein JTB14_037585 [Gonioctena quinquepunctata]|nr:hypothetical protein JTB14_037585 [Gonioctena quinquepunctata]